MTRAERQGLVALVMVTAVAFAPVLAMDFVWDDEILVLGNSLTHSWGTAMEFFRIGLWESTPIAEEVSAPYYRPLMGLSLTLDRTLWGFSAAGHHVHSLVWHLVCVVLVQRWLASMVPDVRASVAGAALFALHPLQAEVVAFVAARNDALALAGALGAVLLLAPRQPGARRLAAAFFCALGGLLAKESALLVPVLMALTDVGRGHRPRGLFRYGVLVAALGVGWRLRFLADLPGVVGTDVVGALRNLPEFLAIYADRLLVPWDLNPAAYHQGRSVPWWTLVPLTGCVALALWRGGRVAAVGLCWALAVWIPALLGVVLTGGLPNRYAYASLAGVGLALAASLPRDRRPWPAVGLVVLLAYLTTVHLPIWSSSRELWRHAFEVSPSSDTACGYFKALEALDDPEAPVLLQASLTMPPSPYCCLNASRYHVDRQQWSDAMKSGQHGLAVGCAPTPELLAPLALAEAVNCEWSLAEQHALGVGADPTGYSPLVLSAAALRRGDDTVLRTWENRGSGGSLALSAQVQLLLEGCAGQEVP